MRDVIVVGAGLAGLSCTFEVAKQNDHVRLLESHAVLGGRTASWVQDGMPVESGLHKFLGIYRALPQLLQECGVNTEDIVTWVDELVIMNTGLPDAHLVTSPYHHPLQTLATLLDNTDLIPLAEKAKLVAFAAAGAALCVADPLELDRISIADYARQFNIHEDVIAGLLSTSTQGVLFLAAEQFSAYAVFAPIVEGLKSLLNFRIGAFNGGMTEVMIMPIARAIEARGGIITPSTPVTSLVVENQRVAGVMLSDGTVLRADHVVLATPLHVAQDLLRVPFGSHSWFQPMLRLPMLSAATIQFELDQPLFSTDHTNFSSTAMCCFAEQAHTTFRHVPGRFSVILYPADDFIGMTPEQVAERTYQEADRLGLPLRAHARRYRIVHHPKDFYAMRPGTEALRPTQATPIPGLSLAGDYTRQPFVASMEGAVISGQRAAEAIYSL